MPVLSRCYNIAIVVVIVVMYIVVAYASHKELKCSRRAHKCYAGDKLQLPKRNSNEVARA